MKISLSWLGEYIDISDLKNSEIADMLTMTGLEVENIEESSVIPGGLEGLIIGEIKSIEKHPNADKLTVTKVDLGNGELRQIVCGAPNVYEALHKKVVVAPVNTTIYPTEGEPFTIKKAKMRGEVSEGMICAEDEIGLGTSHDGIMILNTDLDTGQPLKKLFPDTVSTTLEIGLTPNRTDAISHLGVARDLYAVTGKKVNYPKVDHFEIENTAQHIEVEVESFEECPRYSGVCLSGLKVTESPDWLKKKLLAIGLTPINNLVDVTNFVMHETGQPLHAFDLDKIKDRKLIIRKLKNGTPFKSLDEKDRKLSGDDLMITDPDGPLCIAGVFGGIDSGVSDTTTRVFIESAVFSSDLIRKTSAYHNLKTDASFRFERGVDPNGTLYALKRAALLMKEVGGGTISSNVIDLKKDEFKPRTVTLNLPYVHTLIGKDLEDAVIEQILTRLDFTILNKKGENWEVNVPTYRTDVVQPADIAEEILRIYGFNNVELSDYMGSTFLSYANPKESHTLKMDIRNQMTGLGYYEVLTNSLTKKSYVEKFDLNSDELVYVTNSSSEDLMYLKPVPYWTVLESIRRNQAHRQRSLQFFEFAKTYHKTSKGYTENEWLCLYLCGESTESWDNPGRPYSYNQLLDVVNAILKEKFKLEFTINELTQHADFQYGIEIFNKNKLSLGVIGVLHPQIVEHFDVLGFVFYAQLNWNLISGMSGNVVYYPIPKYPEVKRDLSLVIDHSITYDQIKKLAQQSGGKLIRNMQVFDVYRGDKIDEGKKAYAISFTLQDEDKTLTDKVIDKTMNRLMSTFENELGAVIRK